MKNETVKFSACNGGRITAMRRSRLLCLIAIYFIALVCTVVRANAQCVPVFSSGCGSGVDIHTCLITGEQNSFVLDSASGCTPGAWNDYSSDTLIVYRLADYPVYVNSETIGGHIQVFIDYDDDGTFLMGETAGGVSGLVPVPGASSFLITIPPAAPLGIHTMRVAVSGTHPYPSIPGCGPLVIGEVNDYIVKILPGSPCIVPHALGFGAGGVTSSTVDLVWTAGPGATGFQYVIDTFLSSPPGVGTTTLTAGATVSGLMPSTTYYAHIRDTCGPGSYSPWSIFRFTTSAPSACPSVSGLAATGVTSTSATISWTAAGGSAGYQYAVGVDPFPPVGSGTVTASTSVSATSLTPATAYYAHVRDSCGPGNLSAWVTISFTTTATGGVCPAVSGLAIAGITPTSATISWSAAAGSVGYKYVVNTTAAAPVTAGAFTAMTSYNATGLTPSTMYYAHVRDSCGPGNVSGWVNQPFMTMGTTEIRGTGEAVEAGMRLSPNPVTDILTIALDGSVIEEQELEIADLSGRVFITLRLTKPSTMVDLSWLSGGVYFCRLTNGQRVQTERFVKK
jgi:hypothetical protein